MKRFTIAICCVALLAACNDSKTDAAVTTDSKDSTANTANAEYAKVDSATMMKAWQEYMTPGPMHQLMGSSNGTWSGEMKMWMTPDAPPSTQQVSATFRPVYNGLYQEGVHTGNFGGMPFEGRSIMGYDNSLKKFVSQWYDNMGSGFMTMEGTYDSTSKTFNFTGHTTNFVTGKPCNIRETVQIIDSNTQLMKMWGPDFSTGKEYQTMEIRMTRKN